MPYKTKKVGSKTCVYKKHGGAKVGCTKGSGKKYLAALHANAESKENLINDLFDEIISEKSNT